MSAIQFTENNFITNNQMICTTLFPPDSWLPYQQRSITTLWWV